MLILSLAAALSVSSAGFADDGDALPAPVSFTAFGLYPETATWSAREGRFFVGSLRDGSIGQVSPDGRYSLFATDPRLMSTVGVRSDDAHDRL